MAAVFLLAFGALIPGLPSASAVALAAGVPHLDSLDGGNPRDDHTFTGATGTWSTVGSLIYEQAGNTGDFRSELRRASPAGAIVASDAVGNFYTHTPLSVLAVDGWNLNASDTFYVSEILNNGAPSYAVEMESTPTTIFGTPFTDVSSMGANGVIQTYQVFLNKRDTVDVSLEVPGSYTYNYNLQLYLFGGGPSVYYSATAGASPGFVAASGGPTDSDQFLRYTAAASGWYLLAVGNTKELADVPYNLTVYTNGRALGDASPATGQVDNFNTNDDYTFANALSDWGFTAVRNDAPGYGKGLTAELHFPTFDSNVLASESPTTGSLRVGVIAENRYENGTADNSLVTVKWGPSALYPVPYTVERDNRVPVLPSNTTAARFAFRSGEILRGASVALNRGETVDLHAAVDAFFTYPYELQLLVFPPGDSYYAAAGPAPGRPIAAARDGVNAPKDIVFTAPSTGFYGIALLSLNSTYDVPVDLTVNVQGVPLQHNDVAAGSLSDADLEDLYSFAVDADRWGIVAGRPVGASGSYLQRLHEGGFDATPVAWDALGAGAAAFGLEAVNGYVAAPGTYYASVLRTSGTVGYALEFDSAPLALARNGRTNVTVPDGQLVTGLEVSLNAGETADFRLRVDPGFAYPYALRLFLFSPASPYFALSGAGAPGALASSTGTPGSEQDFTVVAPFSGSYLVVLANLGNLTAVPSTLDVRINGEPVAPGAASVGDLSAANSVNYYSFDAPPAAWTVAGVKVAAATSAASVLVHSLHGPTPDSLPLATDRPRGVGGEGVIAVDGFALPSNTTYYLAESAALGAGEKLTYEVQVASAFIALSPTSQVVEGTLGAASQFIGYTVALQPGQTLDLRLRRAEGFSYPYNLGLFVFRPGSGNASSSGEAGGAPMVASVNGASVEEDGIFTATAAGSHLIVVASLDVPREVNFTLNLTLDGWALADGAHLNGDLNSYNREDQYRFQAGAGAWSAAGVKWTGGTGALRGGLHTLGLNTLPLSTVDASPSDPVAMLPFFAPANSSNASTTFFLNVTLSPALGAPTGEYAVGFVGTPPLFGNPDIGNVQSFTLPGSGFFSLHALELIQGDWVEIRVAVNATYTKQNDLNIALYGAPLAPAVLQTTPLAASHNAPGFAEVISFFANDSGTYLLVVENSGNLDSVPYTLSVTRHTVLGTPPRAVNVTVMGTGRDFIEVTWTQSDESDFEAYEVYVSTDPGQLGVPFDRITQREATYEKIEGSDIKPGSSYTVRVVVYDREHLNSWSSPVTAVTQAKTLWEDSSFQLLVISAIAVGVVVAFAYLRTRQVRDGKPFRVRSSKAEGTVEERKGPRGKLRAPKEETALVTPVPAAPTPKQQEAVDYMQRVMKGGR